MGFWVSHALVPSVLRSPFSAPTKYSQAKILNAVVLPKIRRRFQLPPPYETGAPNAPLRRNLLLQYWFPRGGQ